MQKGFEKWVFFISPADMCLKLPVGRALPSCHPVVCPWLGSAQNGRVNSDTGGVVPNLAAPVLGTGTRCGLSHLEPRGEEKLMGFPLHRLETGPQNAKLSTQGATRARCPGHGRRLRAADPTGPSPAFLGEFWLDPCEPRHQGTQRCGGCPGCFSLPRTGCDCLELQAL